MRWIYLILILLCWAPTHAQTNLDSLWAVWSNERQSDTIRLAAMDEYTEYIAQTHNPDSAIQKIMLMLDLAIKNKSRYYQARSYEAIGDAQMRKPEMSAAAKSYTIAIELFEEINSRKRIAGCLWNLGLVYYQMGLYSKALVNYSKSLAIYEEPGISGSTSGLLNNIGLIYELQKNYSKALEYFEKSAQIAVEQSWSNDVAKGNVGGIYLIQGEYDKALQIFQEILESNKKKQGNYYEIGMSTALKNIAEFYVEIGNYDLALRNYLEGLEHAYKDSISIGTNVIETNIGLLYERIGKTKLAIDWCTKGLNTAIKGKSIKLEQNSCECLYKAYKTQGDESSALEYFERFHMLSDSLKLEETAKSLQKMEFAKQILADSLKQAKENLRIELMHKNEVLRKDQTRNILIGLGAILFLLAIGLYSRYRYVNRSKKSIEKEKKRSDNLLLNILPAEIAEELKDKGEAAARDFDMASVLFTDFKGFTQASANLSARELVDEINTCFKAFDAIIEKHGVEKIKTIGDAYMVAGGLPVPNTDSVKNTILAAIDMQLFIKQRKSERDVANLPAFEMRAGIHTGPVVAGIVGVKKFQYDIWGDTVNTASRMESAGEIGKVNISQSTYDLVKDDPSFSFESRGEISAKGKEKWRCGLWKTK